MKVSDFTAKFIKRYHELIYDTNERIIWPLCKDEDGYGYDKLYVNKKNKTIKAHRAAYVIFKGELPNGLLVCHTCDNPSCINPKHLWAGTHKDNHADQKNKGRLNTLPSYYHNINYRNIRQDSRQSDGMRFGRCTCVEQSNENNGHIIKLSKISTADVKMIREKAKQGILQAAIAQEYNISKAHVSYIVNNKTRLYL